MNSTFSLRRSLSRRLQEGRIERFGGEDSGLAALADALDLPAATWRNYENGVVMPADVLLKFIEVTRATAHWLLTGNGKRYAGRALGSRSFEGH
jgi:hypothetical protein